jgi:tRNA 2-thiouridine synthesizing protein A
MAMFIHRQLDYQGVPWPLTLSRLSNTMRDLSSGELIEILSTDPESVRALDTWSRATGNPLLESSQFGNVLRFVVRKL